MTAYFDTAYVVKCYVLEPGSDAVRALAANVDELVSSELARVEFAAAIQRRRREKVFSRRDADAVLAQFESDCAAHVWSLVSINSVVIDHVTQTFASLPATVAMRSADALHCATVASLGLRTIYSNDKQLLAGAKYFGVDGVNVI